MAEEKNLEDLTIKEYRDLEALYNDEFEYLLKKFFEDRPLVESIIINNDSYRAVIVNSTIQPSRVLLKPI